MPFLERLPLPVILLVWVASTLAFASATKSDVLSSAFAIVGVVMVAGGTARAVGLLGRGTALMTAAVGLSAGPWLALITDNVATGEALQLAVVAALVAVVLRAEVPKMADEGALVYFGLRERPHDAA